MATGTYGIATEQEAASIGGVSGITSKKAVIESKLADLGCKVKSNPSHSYTSKQCVKYIDIEKNEVTFNCNLYYKYIQCSATVSSDHREGNTIIMTIPRTWFFPSSSKTAGGLFLRGTFDGDYSVLGNFNYTKQFTQFDVKFRGKVNGVYTYSTTDYLQNCNINISINSSSKSITDNSVTFNWGYIEYIDMDYSGFSPVGSSLSFPYPTSGTSYGINQISTTVNTGLKDLNNRNVKIKYNFNFVTS